MIKVKCFVSTDKLGSEVKFNIEFDESEFEDMTDDEREQYIEDAVFHAVLDHINWNYEKVDDANT